MVCGVKRQRAVPQKMYLFVIWKEIQFNSIES